jgi:F0F1-type ATP synthase epsilon subunit
VELRIIAGERVVFSGAVQAVYAKSPVGWFGVLAKHAPAVFLLEDSPLRVQLSQGEKKFHVRRGVLHVQDDKLTLVAEEVRHA